MVDSSSLPRVVVYVGAYSCPQVGGCQSRLCAHDGKTGGRAGGGRNTNGDDSSTRRRSRADRHIRAGLEDKSLPRKSSACRFLAESCPAGFEFVVRTVLYMYLVFGFACSTVARRNAATSLLLVHHTKNCILGLGSPRFCVPGQAAWQSGLNHSFIAALQILLPINAAT